MCLQGIPIPLRHVVWPLLTEAHAHPFCHDYYFNLDVNKSADTVPIKMDSIRLIDTEGVDSLKELLLKYSVHDTEIGYSCSGLGPVASYLLHYFNPEVNG